MFFKIEIHPDAVTSSESAETQTNGLKKALAKKRQYRERLGLELSKAQSKDNPDASDMNALQRKIIEAEAICASIAKRIEEIEDNGK